MLIIGITQTENIPLLVYFCVYQYTILVKDKAFIQLQLAAARGFKHAHYQHTVDYSNKLKNLILSNEDSVTALLKRFNKRESEEEFKQRKEITKLITGETINRIDTTFVKAAKTDGIVTSFALGTKSVDKPAEYTDNLIGRKSINDYIHDNLKRVRRRDPNAFLAIEFGPFDANKEKPTPYPVIYTSKEVCDFHFNNEDLEFFIVEKNGVFVAYFKGGSFSMVEVEDKAGAISLSNEELLSYERFALAFGGAPSNNSFLKVIIGGKAYIITEFSLGNEDFHKRTIQGMRVGYVPDEATDGATCVTHFHSALPRIERILIANSESDLTIALHVFAQKIVQVEPCKGYHSPNGGHIECSGGLELGTNEACKNCNGSGHEPLNKSAQDVIAISTERRGDSMLNLDNIIRYVKPDLETAKFLEEFIESQTEAALRAVFLGNAFSTQTAKQTATFVQVNQDGVYDAVTPYCQKTSEIYEFIAETRAVIRHDQDLKVTHDYPMDLQLESMNDLVEQYKNSEGAPVEVRKRLRDEIVKRSLNNEPIGMQKALVMILHEPFAEKTESERSSIVNSGLVPKKKQVLWANYNDIMTKLIEDTTKNFMQLSYEEREKLIAIEVDTIMDDLNQTIPF